MFHDEYRIRPDDEFFGVHVGTNDEESFFSKFKGEVRDRIIFRESGVHEIAPGLFVEAKEGDVYDLPVGHNLVVASCSKLIAALIKREPGYTGALYWEVGSGNSSWSDSNPPAPSSNDTKLFAPLYRKAIQPSDITFLDASNNPTQSVTNKIQIVVTFTATEANGYLREFGIFGGNATDTLGSGLMINRKTHGVIYKTSGIDLQRTLRLTF